MLHSLLIYISFFVLDSSCNQGINTNPGYFEFVMDSAFRATPLADLPGYLVLTYFILRNLDLFFCMPPPAGRPAGLLLTSSSHNNGVKDGKI